MNGKISFGTMFWRMLFRWTLLGTVSIALFAWFFISENPGQDLNRPAQITDEQWADMKARKAEGKPIYRPRGPSEAAWANVLDHLAIVPGPPTIASPVASAKRTASQATTTEEYRAAVRAEQEEQERPAEPVKIPGHKAVPFPKAPPSWLEQMRMQWQIAQKQKAEGR